ncbi:amino acid adenylation domain-containing protein [Nocardia abscessus]|uniref:amino acid adenylation domain-containing protein n=1 Tax=Nocardia abscessus TaxID=120957 RepID=UPI0024537CB5|nr:amino acid adenylation domain-containing protein [Nocardia abscessus]
MNAVVKCLVWDLDDTLWDGVVLENDAAAPRPAARTVLRLLDERGIMHAIASRGEPAPALAHLSAQGLEEMFCATQIGWDPKSAAVRRIAETLNIGLDAIAFVDNDPVERAEVAAALPQVRCYDADDLAGLPDLAEFNPAVVTQDARERRHRYRAEALRRTSEQSFAGSDAEFLTGLGLVMTVRRAREADLERAHELTVRTHQLNTTGRTFDIEQLRELSTSPTHEVLIATLRDRFGDYGAIGLTVTEFRGGDSVLLLLLMSCRVMSRGVGGALLAHLIDRASARGARCVAEFVPSEVNRVMLVTLRFAGFVVLETGPERVLLDHDGRTAVPNTAHVLVRSADAPTPPGDLVSGLLRRAAQFPDRIALISGDDALTYRELDNRTAELAARLVGAGVRPGEVVLCHLRQDTRTVVAMLAALRAGAAWCLVEPGRPGTRLSALVDEIPCTAVVFDETAPQTSIEEVEALLASAAGRPALVPLGTSGPVGPLPAPAPVTAPAYVITTSGSTGVPKAVVVSRANLAAMISARDYPSTGGESVTLSTCPLTADAALLFAPWALTRGGAVVVPTHRELPDAAAVGALAARTRVTHLVATPSYYRLLLPWLAAAPAAPTVVALAGEALPESLAARHRELLPDTLLMNEYGPTEATVTCVWHTVTDTGTVPIGKPLPGNTAVVLGPRLTPVTDGGTGELYLGGDQITLGYAAHPGLTATRFVADPFAAEPGARMYRTGDLARLTAAGDIDYLGRADGQVQIRGARVERHAVEAVLETHPGVAHAVTVIRTGRDEIAELVAFVVPADDTAPPGRRELARHCAERLSPMEVPSRFVPIDTIPIAAAGKLDESVLLARADDPPLPGPPRGDWTSGQREIAELWSTALEHDDFDLDDSFFDVGGNSHRVVVLHLLMEQHSPGAVRVGQLFDLRTVRDQAAAIADGVAPAMSATPSVPVSTRTFEL